MHRRKLCPGSHHAEDGLPEETSEEAEEGQMLHALAADYSIPRDHLNPEQNEALDRAEEIEDEIVRAVVESDDLAGVMFVQGAEKELWLHYRLKPVLSGHCDFWRYYPAKKVLIIIDRKFGRGDVPQAAINLQLRAYATQADQEWRCDRIYVAIVQPRVYGAGARSVACYDRVPLVLANREMLAILWDCEPLNAPRHASPDACQYCKAKTACDEYRKPLLQLTPANLPLAELPADKLAECLLACQFATKIEKEVKAEMRTRILAGEMPGWTLVPNAPRRSIKDAPAAFSMLRAAGFTDLELFHAVGLTVGNAEKLYTAKGRKAKEAKACVNHLLADVIETKEIEMSIERIQP